MCCRKCYLTIEQCCLIIENCFETPEIAEPLYMLNSTKRQLAKPSESATDRGLEKPQCPKGSTDSRNRPGDYAVTEQHPVPVACQALPMLIRDAEAAYV